MERILGNSEYAASWSLALVDMHAVGMLFHAAGCSLSGFPVHAVIILRTWSAGRVDMFPAHDDSSWDPQ